MSNQNNKEGSSAYVAAFSLLILVVATTIAGAQSSVLKIVGVIAIFIISVSMGYTIKAQGKTSAAGNAFTLDDHQFSIVPGMQ